MGKGIVKKVQNDGLTQQEELLALFAEALANHTIIDADILWGLWYRGTSNISRAFMVRKLGACFKILAKRQIIRKGKSFKLSQRTSKPLPQWERIDRLNVSKQ
jgi:hypothetical protein